MLTQDSGWLEFPAGRQRITNTTFACTGDEASMAAAAAAAVAGSKGGGTGSTAPGTGESPPLRGAFYLAAAALAAVLALQFAAAGSDRRSADSRALASLVEYRVAYSKGWILKRLLGGLLPALGLAAAAGQCLA